MFSPASVPLHMLFAMPKIISPCSLSSLNITSLGKLILQTELGILQTEWGIFLNTFPNNAFSREFKHVGYGPEDMGKAPCLMSSSVNNTD